MRRFARTHGPFTTQEAAARFDLPGRAWSRFCNGWCRVAGWWREVFGRVGFTASGATTRYCGRFGGGRWRGLRKEVEPVEQRTLARLFTRWQGVVQPRRGLDALLDVIENLQGAPLPASILETEILPARLVGYKPADLDTLIAAGEVVWVGLDPIGERDGRIGLYLAEKLSALWPIAPSQPTERILRDDEGNVIPVSVAEMSKETEILEYLKRHGASFFQDLHDGVGGGYPGETLEALWSLVWKGLVDQRWHGGVAGLL